MEQMRQNEAGALTAQAIPQKDVEQACFHALGLIGRNCEYLDQRPCACGCRPADPAGGERYQRCDRQGWTAL